MTGQRRRAGFVGAGEISPVHVEAVQALDHVDIVGITDLDVDRAAKRAAEYGIRSYPNLDDLVAAGADTIHVLTPPAAHHDVAVRAMELGCDVFIEKPLALNVEDCEDIAATARATGKVATVDHLMLFNPQVQEALATVASGAIGRPVSVDIIRGGELPDYFGGPLSPFLADAGFPYRDLGIHCLSLIAAFLGPIEDVKAEWRSLGGEPSLAFDEWRTLVSCRDGIGQFQLTWNVKPIQNQVIVQGTNGVLRLDLFSLFSSHRRATPGPRAAERLVNALAESTATASGTVKGAAMFASGKVKRLQGVRDHVADFYARLDDGRPMTVDLEGATQLVRWNEAVARAAEADQAERIAALGPADGAVDVLVTGASGSVGSNVVARLLDSGTSVRCLVRRVPNHPLPGVQYVVGNLGDPAAVDAAVAGAKRVVHAGATMQGSEADFESGTVVGTRNVVESCLRHGVTQLVHISSLAVLDYGGADHGRALDEDSPLEPLPHERGLYTRTKAEAEAIVREAVERHSLPAVIVRPGLIFGGGVDLVTGAVARRAGEGRWLVLGDGEAKLSLIYMDDVVDALMLTIDQDLTDGQIIQLVDPVTPTQDELLAALGDGRKVVHLPASVLRTIGRMSDPLFRKLGRSSPLGPHRLRAGLAHLEFNGTNASKLLGWSPKVGVWEGVKRELSPTPE